MFNDVNMVVLSKMMSYIGLNMVFFGCIMIMMFVKLIKVLIYFVAFIFFFKNTRASTSVNNGMVKFSVVIIVMGVMVKFLMYKNILFVNSVECVMCSGIRLVANDFFFFVVIIGIIVNVVNKNCRNIICVMLRFVLVNFMIMLFLILIN